VKDLDAYVRQYRAGGYPVESVKEIACLGCGLTTSFRVLVDDEQGCAVAICLSCQTETPLADSSEVLNDADLGECACPCGGETFAVAVGFALTRDHEVRWVSIGLRCFNDGAPGVYADWKVDYAPTAHLLADP
jgi:hypothetical protein